MKHTTQIESIISSVDSVHDWQMVYVILQLSQIVDKYNFNWKIKIVLDTEFSPKYHGPIRSIAYGGKPTTKEQ